jgi:Multimeric flavodoxin WrbA
MKIIGYSASPRKDGNTAWVVTNILAGAREKGAVTEFFSAGEHDIKPCRGCLACTDRNKCAVNDDMQSIYAALNGADAIVLGSPIYMGQMTAQAKAFTDRLFAQITPRFSPRFKEKNAGKKMILSFTQGNPDKKMFAEYIAYTEKMFRMLEFDVTETVVVAGTRTTPACEQLSLDSELKRIGESLL